MIGGTTNEGLWGFSATIDGDGRGESLKEFDDTRCGCVTKNRSKLFEPKDRPYMLTLDVLV